MTTPDTSAAWLARSRDALARIALSPHAETMGRVERIADGIAHVSGLPDVRLGELLRFEGGQTGFALTLEVDDTAVPRPQRLRPASCGHRPSVTHTLPYVLFPSLLGNPFCLVNRHHPTLSKGKEGAVLLARHRA